MGAVHLDVGAPAHRPARCHPAALRRDLATIGTQPAHRAERHPRFTPSSRRDSFELDNAPFDLHDLVKSIGSALQARADEKGLQSGVHIGMSCPRFVKGDAGRLRQILANLIDNAVKFTRARLGASACQCRRDGRQAHAPLRRHRHRHRSQRGRAGAAVPALRPGRSRQREPIWRHRPRSFHRPAAGRADGRRDRLRERARVKAACSGSPSRPCGRCRRAPKDTPSYRHAVRPCPRGRGQRRQPHADRRLSR